MSYYGGHPSPFEPHPWTDPLQPPRPDDLPGWVHEAAGLVAPDPTEFPLTEDGRRAYMQAVEDAARARQAQEDAQRAAASRGRGRTPEVDRVRTHLLLLRR